MKELHLSLIKAKPAIVKVLLISQTILFGTFIVLFFVYFIRRNGSFPDLIPLGRTLGDIALILYTITLIPGILGRFRIFPTLRSILMLFRRYIGDHAFLLALIHGGITYSFPIIFSGAPILQVITSHEVYGYVALIIFFPMWITSNDYSVRKMGKYWKLLHRITYVAILFLFLHIATEDILYGTIALIMLILEIFSWIAEVIFQVRGKSELQSQDPQ